MALGDSIALNVRVCIINNLLCTFFTCLFYYYLLIPFIVSFYPFYLVKEGGFKSMEGVYGRRAFFVSSMTFEISFFWCPMCVSLILLYSISWAFSRLSHVTMVRIGKMAKFLCLTGYLLFFFLSSLLYGAFFFLLSSRDMKQIGR